MTDHETRRPPACHYDRTLQERVTREHRDDCPNPATHGGCAPCTAPHCVVCGREHVTNDHPLTCPTCVGKVRDDLADIQSSYTALSTEALEAGADGRLVAAAPIPGGTAAVLIGPTVRLDLLRVNRHTRDDHAVDRKGHSHDPLPPLAVLAQWEDMWRAWLGHARGRRATIGAAITYLRDNAAAMAQQEAGGPDWQAFTRQVRNLRAHLERALHDEREPELGVECFECGDRLVRRFRDRRLCRHDTPPRLELTRWLRLGYPEALTALDARAARVPCGRCSQGGLDDPTAGLSWECPGCRKDYTAGEYTRAVRNSLIETDGLGWCLITTAAQAAEEITGRPITPATIRTWIVRGDDIGVACAWRPELRFGVQVVFWPDVLDRAQETRRTGPRRRSA